MKSTGNIQNETSKGKIKKSVSCYSTYDTMDAIAHGVQARLDERTSFSRRVTDETVNTARALGVPNTTIETWAIQRLNRLTLETERLRQIKNLLERGRDTPLEQITMHV
jgi:hypothetical protein